MRFNRPLIPKRIKDIAAMAFVIFVLAAMIAIEVYVAWLYPSVLIFWAVVGAAFAIASSTKPSDNDYRPWFAWRPVKTWNGDHWLWLETIDRRRDGWFDGVYQIHRDRPLDVPPRDKANCR